MLKHKTLIIWKALCLLLLQFLLYFLWTLLLKCMHPRMFNYSRLMIISSSNPHPNCRCFIFSWILHLLNWSQRIKQKFYPRKMHFIQTGAFLILLVAVSFSISIVHYFILRLEFQNFILVDFEVLTIKVIVRLTFFLLASLALFHGPSNFYYLRYRILVSSGSKLFI